jgi:phosphate transport system substrate-binding protein
MQGMLEGLNAVPGVLGSMLYDRDGRVLAHALPVEHGAAELRQAAEALARSSGELRSLAGAVSLVDLHYARHRLVLRPVGAGTLLLLCDSGASPQQLLASVSQVVARHERGGAGPGAAAPVRQPASTVRAPAARPPAPRRSAGIGARGGLLLAAAVGALVLALGVGIVLALRGAPHPGLQASAPQTILRLGGAKAMAEELAPALAEAYLASLEATDIAVDRASAHQFTVRGTKDGATVAIAVLGDHTPKGFDALLAGEVDIAMSGRRVKADEQQKLASLGAMTSPANEHVVALSAMAVIVNAANPVAQLDRAQLAAIFGGASAEWPAVAPGLAARPIRVFVPAQNMGLHELFKSFVLGKAPYAAHATQLPSFQEIADAVAGDPDAVGVVTLPFVRGARAVPVAESDDPPLIPTAFTVAAEDYFLTHRLYLYTAQRSDSPHVSKFVQFALGPEGQALVKRSGYVELSVGADQRVVPAGAPAEFVRLTRDARRLTSTFRFEVGAAAFDTRALRDLERVTRYLVDNRLNGAAVRVLGFADALGSRDHNVRLSAERADLVVKALAQRGVTGVSVAALGPDLPVASNATEVGRQRNRRVEIWVAE